MPKRIRLSLILIVVCVFRILLPDASADGEDMDKTWGKQVLKLRASNSERGQLFNDGNYAMFIHWGLYSNLGNRYKGKDYYGIGEWIMASSMAGIPVDEYKNLAKEFNPEKFNAMEIVQLAKDAGMKYIIITSKHHDGFAMYHSKACEFNIVDATPFDRDPMKELADACQKVGIGFGFYYSHNQDWTFPGGKKGPTRKPDGKKANFEYYFQKKCLPQVKEITTLFGPIELVWFDTPGNMPKHYVQQLVDEVRKNQPKALVSGRAGHGLGDYRTLGDMEVPHGNVRGMWEAVDTTNDSWAYAWYDENWKTPEEILRRVIACVGRGGTYMLNIGPRGDGSIPERTAKALRSSGDWIKRYPQVVYGADASPWKHPLPWGDVTAMGKTLNLCVFDWPSSGKLYLPGLKTDIKRARLLSKGGMEDVRWNKGGSWTVFSIPDRAPEKLASVITLEFEKAPEVDPCWGLDPEAETVILAEFASVSGAKKAGHRWMEKFGEWKHATRVTNWSKDGTASWEADVAVAGDYQVGLTYSGKGRIVWGVDIEGGEHIRNQQDSSHIYQEFPIGWLNFPKPGRYTVSVSALEGNTGSASLKSIHFERVDL